jgi:hypothetical protein
MALNKWDLFTIGSAIASFLGAKAADKFGELVEVEPEIERKLPILYYEGNKGYHAGYLPSLGYKILAPEYKKGRLPLGPIMHEYAHLDSKWQRQWLKFVNTNPWAGVLSDLSNPKMMLLHTLAGAVIPGNLGYIAALLPQLPTLAAETQANLKVIKWALQGHHKTFGRLSGEHKAAAIGTALGSLLNYWGAAAATVGSVYATRQLLGRLGEELKKSPKNQKENR